MSLLVILSTYVMEDGQTATSLPHHHSVHGSDGLCFWDADSKAAVRFQIWANVKTFFSMWHPSSSFGWFFMGKDQTPGWAKSCGEWIKNSIDLSVGRQFWVHA